MSKPVFNNSEQLLLWQGIQKLINEAGDHQTALLKGFQGTEPDPNTSALNDAYNQRIKECKDIQTKLPSISKLMKD